jgi:phospho-N-acetylmuramoyl-pentapeptide-transferase
MIYHLFEYLSNSGVDFPGIGLMQYITFRSLIALMTALLVALYAGPRIIRKLQKKQIGEEIRDLGLEGQMQKKGTPTMGGIIIIMSILIPALLFGNLTNIYVQLLIVSAIWLGLIGFLDDSIKVFKKNKDGLSGKYKIIGQVTLGLVVGIALCMSEQTNLDVTLTNIPFFKGNQFDYSWLSPFDGEFGEIFTRIIYVAVIIFIITAVSNGSNLTDGMDGLATGVSAFIGITLAILAYLSGNTIYASYLDIMYIPHSGEVVIFMSAFIGALVGFLWYNTYPAQVFMGDTGSLMLGGIIGVTAVLIRKELLIPILCGVFFAESVSVLAQRIYFKYTKKKYGEGRRIFKMAPLHHHFQKEGIPCLFNSSAKALPEAKIVTRFWIVGMILAVITIALLKVR